MTEPWTFSVLISGKLGSGKTTTQNGLFRAISFLLPENTVLFMANFADELKNECATRAGVPASVFYTEEGKAAYYPSVQMTGRELLQTVGEQARQADPDHWIKRVKERIARAKEMASSPNVLVIVGDCRHPNEVDGMRPGFAVRLVGDPNGVRVRSTADLMHISETAMDGYEGFDCTINTELLSPTDVVAVIMSELAKLAPARFGSFAPAAEVDMTNENV
jgi:hypothetical protein